MPGPETTPEQGISRYKDDPTQGPACAMAAAAGTLYRNYFVELDGQLGQTADKQIDCLADMGIALGNIDNRLWRMKNGYVKPTASGLKEINRILHAASEQEIDDLRQRLRVGIQWQTEVTLENAGHTVSQIFCSALPVSCFSHPVELWASFAQLVLEACYEASLCAATINYLKTGNNKIYLTLVGGSAFGNQIDWITNAILRALNQYRDTGLEVNIVSYRQLNQEVEQMIQQYNDAV